MRLALLTLALFVVGCGRPDCASVCDSDTPDCRECHLQLGVHLPAAVQKSQAEQAGSEQSALGDRVNFHDVTTVICANCHQTLNY